MNSYLLFYLERADLSINEISACFKIKLNVKIRQFGWKHVCIIRRNSWNENRYSSTSKYCL